MKLTLILAALALPASAQAQSLTDTHELTWYPAGKGQYRAAKTCPTVAKKPVAATTAN
jgi:hypothetical protein